MFFSLPFVRPFKSNSIEYLPAECPLNSHCSCRCSREVLGKGRQSCRRKSINASFHGIAD
jgi:hypothetical protein